MKLRNIEAVAMALSLMQQAEAQRTSGNGQGKPQPASDKAPKFSKREVDLDNQEVVFIFGDGGEDVTARLADFPEEIRVRLALHGISQKGGDSFAGVKGNFKEARANLQDVLEALKNGDWRTAGDEARPRLAELAEAIARIKGADLEKVKAAVEAASDEDRKNWRSNAGVKAEIAKIRAEKAAQQLDRAGSQELSINIG